MFYCRKAECYEDSSVASWFGRSASNSHQFTTPLSNMDPVLAQAKKESKQAKRNKKLVALESLLADRENEVEQIRREIMKIKLKSSKSGKDKQDFIVSFFRNDYYGNDSYIPSPFNNNYEIRVMYCDWTASGKPLKSIEKYISTNVLPLYANTHTQTSVTGKQTTLFRNESRNMILTSESIKGDLNNDVVLFVGSGVTGAIYKLAHILARTKGFNPEKTVVFIGIYEHNSNILIWKELGINVIVIPEYEVHSLNNKIQSANSSKNGKKYGINVEILERYLQEYQNKSSLMIGSFSAASNVSGIIEKHDDITRLLHQYGALSFWDFATAGPYLDMKMNDRNDARCNKDAVFISTHKFLGGPGAPGLLICKQSLCCNKIPVVPGGGTVFFAYGTKEDKEYEYHRDIAEREEGGTPDIIGSIRAALTFMCKDKVGVRKIEEIEHRFIDRFFKLMKNEIDSGVLKIIGNIGCMRLPIISFNIQYKGKFLHFNYVAALFNDLFGVQGRGGCSCAGMYGYSMLKEQVTIDIDYMMNQLLNENELARFGYYRINFHYTLSEEEFEYIVDCVKYICEHGWKFIALYGIDVKSGLFIHRSQMPGNKNRGFFGGGGANDTPMYKSLKDITFPDKSSKYWGMSDKNAERYVERERIDSFDEVFEFADNILRNMKQYIPSAREMKNEIDTGDDQRFYWLPSELYEDVCKNVV